MKKIALALALVGAACNKPAATAPTPEAAPAAPAAAPAPAPTPAPALAAPPANAEKLAPFSGVRIAIAGKTTIQHAAAASIAFGCAPAVRERLVAKVDGNQLDVRTVDDRSTDADRCDLTITTPTLSVIKLAGSADITADTFDKTGAIDTSGSGTIRLGELALESFEVKIAGSGSVTATGKTRSSTVLIAGAGTAELLSLESAQTKVSIAGSGDAKVNATETLDIKTVGAGNVSYRGAAKVTEMQVGSGSITKL